MLPVPEPPRERWCDVEDGDPHAMAPGTPVDIESGNYPPLPVEDEDGPNACLQEEHNHYLWWFSYKDCPQKMFRAENVRVRLRRHLQNHIDNCCRLGAGESLVVLDDDKSVNLLKKLAQNNLLALRCHRLFYFRSPRAHLAVNEFILRTPLRFDEDDIRKMLRANELIMTKELTPPRSACCLRRSTSSRPRTPYATRMMRFRFDEASPQVVVHVPKVAFGLTLLVLMLICARSLHMVKPAVPAEPQVAVVEPASQLAALAEVPVDAPNWRITQLITEVLDTICTNKIEGTMPGDIFQWGVQAFIVNDPFDLFVCRRQTQSTTLFAMIEENILLNYLPLPIDYFITGILWMCCVLIICCFWLCYYSMGLALIFCVITPWALLVLLEGLTLPWWLAMGCDARTLPMLPMFLYVARILAANGLLDCPPHCDPDSPPPDHGWIVVSKYF